MAQLHCLMGRESVNYAGAPSLQVVHAHHKTHSSAPYSRAVHKNGFVVATPV